MGRLFKNPDSVANAGLATSTLVPGGSTIDRPDTPKGGQNRYNTSTNSMEYWDDSSWQQGAVVGNVTITKDSFIGNAALLTFSMSIPESNAANIIVSIGGILQEPDVSFTVDGSNTITFTSAPPNLTTIVVLHGYNEVI